MPELTPEDAKKLEASIKRDEGLRLVAYLDTKGVLTIGYGHNCKASPVRGVLRPGDSIPREEAERLFKSDLGTAMQEVRRNFPWAANMAVPRQAVLIEMVFNMGVGSVADFKKALAAMMRGDWAIAKAEMLRSKWLDDVGPRAVRLANRMERGTW